MAYASHLPYVMLPRKVRLSATIRMSLSPSIVVGAGVQVDMRLLLLGMRPCRSAPEMGWVVDRRSEGFVFRLGSNGVRMAVSEHLCDGRYDHLCLLVDAYVLARCSQWCRSRALVTHGVQR